MLTSTTNPNALKFIFQFVLYSKCVSLLLYTFRPPLTEAVPHYGHEEQHWVWVEYGRISGGLWGSRMIRQNSGTAGGVQWGATGGVGVGNEPRSGGQRGWARRCNESWGADPTFPRRSTQRKNLPSTVELLWFYPVAPLGQLRTGGNFRLWWFLLTCRLFVLTNCLLTR